jgi:lipopolysaccharide exporter
MMATITDAIKLLQGDSLKAKSARGVLTLSTGAGVERMLRLVRTMILTRILAPDQFGLMAIVLVLVNVFEQFSEVGIKLSVIQNKRGHEYEFLNATWWFQVVRGIGLFAIAMVFAPWVSSFYGKPHLLVFLQAALLAVVFRGFISPRSYVLQKEYRFVLVVLHIQGSALLGTIVSVVCALKFRNMWALIIGYLVENLCLCILSYIVAPFKPRFGIDRTCLNELTIFARGMFGMPIISIIGDMAPTFILGKMVTENALGLFALAGQLANIPLIFFNSAINPVILSGFVKKQDNQMLLCSVVLKATKILAVAAIPLVVYMIVCSSGLLYFLWGPQYVDVTIPCALFCFLVIVKPQSLIFSNIYVSVGKPYLQRRFVILMTLIIILFIYPAIVYWGLNGAAVTTVAGCFAALFMQIFWSRRVIPLKFDEYIKCYIPGLLLSFPPLITIFLLVIFGIESMPVIIVSGALVLFFTYIVYFGSVLLLKSHKTLFEVKNKINVFEVIQTK